MRWVALLLIVPLVAAGSSENPEISDQSGDTTAGRGDLVAAWFEPVDELHIDAYATIAEITDGGLLVVDLLWDIASPLGVGESETHGVRTYIEPEDDRAFSLYPKSTDEFWEMTDISVTVTRGAPAQIALTDVPSGGQGWGGGNLTNFRATVVANPPSLPVIITGPGGGVTELDDATGTGSLAMPVGGTYSEVPWNFTGKPLLGPSDPYIFGPGEIEGVWFEHGDDDFLLTVQLRSLTWSELAACDGVMVNWWMMEMFASRSLGGLARLNIDGGWPAQNEWNAPDVTLWKDHEIVGNDNFAYAEQWVFGEPGYYQIRGVDVPYSDWDADLSVSSSCDEHRASIEEPTEYFGKISIFKMVLPTILGVIASIILVRQRKKHMQHK